MQIKNRNLFRINRILIFFLAGLFRRLAKFRTPRKRLLIIKTDAFGDYILFRNFIEIVKKSEKYKKFNIDLLGNSLWEDVAIQYDWAYLHSNIFIDSESYHELPDKTYKLAWRLFKKNYHTVINPTYSRTLMGDAFAAFTGARNIIGFEGSEERILARYKTSTDKFYSTLIRLPADITFEFERSRFFFETILQQKLTFQSPLLKITDTAKNENVILVPGSAVTSRNWEQNKFSALAKLILQHTRHTVYITGTAEEADLCNNLAQGLPDKRVINLAGKTNANQFIDLIASAALVISNETSAIHIAAATKTKCICLLGGGHFNRFAPYPAGWPNRPVFMFEKMDCYNCDWNCKFLTEADETYPCIAAISLESVWQQTKEILGIVK